MSTVIKFLIKSLICVIVVLISESRAQVSNGPELFEKLIKEFIEKLEKSEITGNGLPLSDWSAPINATSYGITALGTVNFHSGFVNSIEIAALDNIYMRTIVEHDYIQINSTFYFKNIRLFYDLEIELSEYSDLGNALILIPKVEYTLSALYHYKTNIKKFEVSSPYVTVAKSQMKPYPYNGYTQLIIQEMATPSFYKPLVDSIKVDWIESIQEKLSEVIATADYPEVCHFCKQLEL